MSALIRYQVAQGVASLTLDRPPLNVLNLQMLSTLGDQLEQIKDSEAKVVVVRAAGKAFCAGVDVADHTADNVGAMIHALHRVFLALWALPQPVLAAVDGAALGGGMELALGCDFILASPQAQFAQPEIKVGVFPPLAALLLPRLVSRSAALECVLLGETWSAQRAHALGLINAVAFETPLEALVEGWVKRLMALSAPVLQLAKRATLIGWDQAALSQRLAQVERLYLEDLMRLEDAQEGLEAFLQRRKPCWKNR